MNPVKKTIKKIEKKQESSRDKILKAAIDLFYSQGYEKTTTRQIIQKAGVLNGSLYHSFSSKEDILKTIIVDALKDALNESEELFSKKETIQDQILVIAFPVALELYVASRSTRAAELLYQAHNSWDILNSFVDVMISWTADHTTLFNQQANKREIYLNVLAIMGAIGNLVGEFANSEYKVNYKESICLGIEVFYAVFKMPAFAVNTIADEMCRMIEENNIQIFDNLLDSSFSEVIREG